MSTRQRRGCIGIVATAVALLAMTAGPAGATYIGENGKITFDVHQSDNSSDIYAIEPDGSNRALLIENGRYSAWSPNGRRIAYTCPAENDFYGKTCTATADGTAVKALDIQGVSSQFRPFWSPDAKRLIVDNRFTFGHNPEEMYAEVWRIDAVDGGDPIRMAAYGLSGSWSPQGRIAYTEFRETFSNTDFWVSTVDATLPNTGGRLTESTQDADPDWSPEGTKIVFESYRAGNNGIYVMNADGSNETQLTNYGFDPVWSPDGTRILFNNGVDLWVMNADGTGQINLTNTPTVYEQDAAWQPIADPGYPRPKGATPLRVSLVPSFERCEQPNRGHGQPLAHPSCAPPDERAGFMTFGAAPGDSTPQSVGHVRLAVKLGTANPPTPSDIAIDVSLTNVRRGSDLADGEGSLQLQIPVRLTDRHNGPFGNMPATLQDLTLKTYVPCAATADTTIGSTCSLSSSANALAPYYFDLPVERGQRAVWQLGQVAVWEGGDDGYIESEDDNRVLAVQGVFVP